MPGIFANPKGPTGPIQSRIRNSMIDSWSLDPAIKSELDVISIEFFNLFFWLELAGFDMSKKHAKNSKADCIGYLS